MSGFDIAQSIQEDHHYDRPIDTEIFRQQIFRHRQMELPKDGAE
jgi:hypothetical protein